jgi:hypothetical protein
MMLVKPSNLSLLTRDQTFNMGLYGPPAPELLLWERKYFTLFTTTLIGVALHSYDTWYWWVGRELMLKTPGDGTTLGFFIYFGQADLYSWVQYPYKVYLAIAVTGFTIHSLFYFFFRALQRRMDVFVPSTRLESLAERWQADLGMQRGRDNSLDTGVLLVPDRTLASRNPSFASKRSSKSGAQQQGMSSEADFEKDEISPSTTMVDNSGKDDKIHDQCSPYKQTPSKLPRNSSPTFIHSIQRSPTQESEPKPLVRTMTERLRLTLLGWKPEGQASALPAYQLPNHIPFAVSYTPTIETLIAASDLLYDANKDTMRIPHIKNWAIPFTPFIVMYIGMRHCCDALSAMVQIIPALFKHGLRPGIILAVWSYGSSMHWERKVSYVRMMLRAVRHPVYASAGISAYDVALASRIMLTLHPPGKPNRTRVLSWGYLNCSLCSLLVIGTELCIQWNKISGVQNLTSVGQLIPAAVGVGGLTKVLYTALYEKDAEIDLCFGRCRGILRRAKWKEASQQYERAANEWQRKREVESLENERASNEKGKQAKRMSEKGQRFDSA